MKQRSKRARGLPLVAMLATGSCFTLGPLCVVPEPPCYGISVCTEFAVISAATSAVRIAQLCPGPACPARAERGSLAVGPSFHPAEPALVIGASSDVAITVETVEPADGAGLSALVRCERGGAIVFMGDERTALTVPAPIRENWARFVALIRAPSRGFVTRSEATTSARTTLVRFSNTATAPCLLARVEYETTTRVCSRSRCIDDSGVASPPDAAWDARTSDGERMDGEGDGASEWDSSTESDGAIPDALDSDGADAATDGDGEGDAS